MQRESRLGINVPDYKIQVMCVLLDSQQAHRMKLVETYYKESDYMPSAFVSTTTLLPSFHSVYNFELRPACIKGIIFGDYTSYFNEKLKYFRTHNTLFSFQFLFNITSVTEK